MWNLWSLSSSFVFKPIYLMYSASSIECCNFIVFHFIQLYSCIALQLYNCIVVIVIICSVVQLIIQRNYIVIVLYLYSLIVIQIIQLYSLYSYSFKQIMSVERPSNPRLFLLIFPKKYSLITQKRFWPFFGVFSGFLGVPQNYIFWSFKSVF